jgi:hypothetical protein
MKEKKQRALFRALKSLSLSRAQIALSFARSNRSLFRALKSLSLSRAQIKPNFLKQYLFLPVLCTCCQHERVSDRYPPIYLDHVRMTATPSRLLSYHTHLATHDNKQANKQTNMRVFVHIHGHTWQQINKHTDIPAHTWLKKDSKQTKKRINTHTHKQTNKQTNMHAHTCCQHQRMRNILFDHFFRDLVVAALSKVDISPAQTT